MYLFQTAHSNGKFPTAPGGRRGEEEKEGRDHFQRVFRTLSARHPEGVCSGGRGEGRPSAERGSGQLQGAWVPVCTPALLPGSHLGPLPGLCLAFCFTWQPLVQLFSWVIGSGPAGAGGTLLGERGPRPGDSVCSGSLGVASLWQSPVLAGGDPPATCSRSGCLVTFPQLSGAFWPLLGPDPRPGDR